LVVIVLWKVGLATLASLIVFSEKKMTRPRAKYHLLAKILAQNLIAHKQERDEEIDFPVDLGYQDPDLADWTEISDPSLRAIWLFADDFFDAVSHGFETLTNGWSIERGLEEMESLIENLQKGEELENQEILQYAEN